jgi:two-component system, chemotaxis family, chemotaxis protein CheY
MSKSIMIVDDSPTMLMSIEAILASEGHKVTACSSGEQALETLNGGNKPHLIITDLHMGGIDGIQLIRKVRELSAFKFMPILILTTAVQQEKRTEAKAAGATGWIVKPVEPASLLQVVRQVVPGA